MLGYSGGFVGPLMIGYILDLAGGMSRIGWGLSFGAISLLMLLHPIWRAASRRRRVARS